MKIQTHARTCFPYLYIGHRYLQIFPYKHILEEKVINNVHIDDIPYTNM